MQQYVNPFLNPTYGNYWNQQPQMQQPMQPGISGRYVNDFSEITANDIPMNSPAIFAKNDRSEIQLREWNPNGQIITTSYKAIQEQPKQELTTNNFLEPIFIRLAELEEKIDKLGKPSTRTKKEGE